LRALSSGGLDRKRPDTGNVNLIANGNPTDPDEYRNKIRKMNCLFDYSRKRWKLEKPFILAGDYNAVNLLGLSGRHLAAEQQHPHRPLLRATERSSDHVSMWRLRPNVAKFCFK
jgi:hypothetical protein